MVASSATIRQPGIRIMRRRKFCAGTRSPKHTIRQSSCFLRTSYSTSVKQDSMSLSTSPANTVACGPQYLEITLADCRKEICSGAPCRYFLGHPILFYSIHISTLPSSSVFLSLDEYILSISSPIHPNRFHPVFYHSFRSFTSGLSSLLSSIRTLHLIFSFIYIIQSSIIIIIIIIIYLDCCHAIKEGLWRFIGCTL
jgi:hypothetical protein